MSKKKKKSKAKASKVTQRPAPKPVAPKILELLQKFGEAAQQRQQQKPAETPSLVKTLIKPPENMIEHLERIGAAHLARVKEVMFGEEPTECLVIPWEALQQAEYKYLASGQWKGTEVGQAQQERQAQQAEQHIFSGATSQAEIMRARASNPGWGIYGTRISPDSGE